MTHPGNMSAWADVKCQRGCERHWSQEVEVRLGGPTAYADFTPIPFETSFDMFVFDIAEHPIDGGPYCPAHDVVSETILSHGVWEPRETTIALWHILNRPGVVVDMGAQLGWYTLLATAHDRQVIAYECDADYLGMIEASLALNGLEGMATTEAERITPASDEILPVEVCFAKLDLEGAEDQGIRLLWPSIQEGMVHAMLVEVSPVFDDYYPGLVNRIINQGYEAYLMPPKHSPPHEIDSPYSLAPWRIDDRSPSELAALVESWHQEDVLFVRGWDL